MLRLSFLHLFYILSLIYPLVTADVVNETNLLHSNSESQRYQLFSASKPKQVRVVAFPDGGAARGRSVDTADS